MGKDGFLYVLYVEIATGCGPSTCQASQAGLNHPWLALSVGLTKMISKLSKEGAYRKALEVFYSLAEMDIAVDTAVVNAAISATDRGESSFHEDQLISSILIWTCKQMHIIIEVQVLPHASHGHVACKQCYTCNVARLG